MVRTCSCSTRREFFYDGPIQHGVLPDSHTFSLWHHIERCGNEEIEFSLAVGLASIISHIF